MEEDTVVRLPRPGASVVDDPLLEVLRSGARQMLQQVLSLKKGGDTLKLSVLREGEDVWIGGDVAMCIQGEVSL